MTATAVRPVEPALAPPPSAGRRWPWLLGVVLVAVFSWPLTSDLEPPLGLDGEWQIALQLAVRDGLDFGPDLLFTYGPLGFLREPVLVDPTLARVAVAWTLVIHLVLCATLAWSLRRSFGSPWLALAATLAVAAAAWREPTAVIAFAGATVLAAGRFTPRRAMLVALALGVLAGIAFLAKLNAGITLVTLGSVAVIAAPEARLRLGGALAGGFVFAAAAGWLATGQSLDAIGDYLTGGVEIVRGYSEDIALVDPEFGAEPGEYAGALALALLGFAVAWRAGEELPRRARLGLLALWALLAFTAFKAAFVRPDALHVNLFFGPALGALAVIGWHARSPRTPVLLGLAVLVILTVSLSRDVGGLPDSFLSPGGRAASLVEQVGVLVDGDRTAERIAAGRAARALDSRVDPAALRLARSRGTHFDPFDSGLAWAYDLPWRPLPVFQSYSAYTPDLDERNAAAFRDPDGPAGVLRREEGGLDGRNRDWESPAAMLTMLCHFRAVTTTEHWQYVKRVPSRCGAEHPLLTTRVQLGEPAGVPAAPDGSVVLAHIDGIEMRGVEKLRALAFRGVTRTAKLDGGRRFRLVAATANDGLIMRVPSSADFPGPFALDQATSTLTITRGAGAQDHRTLTIRYTTLPIH